MSSPRVAIVAGCRTPFARSGTVFRDLTALDLARACVRELVERTEVDTGAIGTVVMGQVVPSMKAPNLGREAALGAGLPKSIPAYSVNRACASSNQAISAVASATWWFATSRRGRSSGMAWAPCPRLRCRIPTPIRMRLRPCGTFASPSVPTVAT